MPRRFIAYLLRVHISAMEMLHDEVSSVSTALDAVLRLFNN